MAESIHSNKAQQQQVAARKISAPVHRTTSESIRLGFDQHHHHPAQSLTSIPTAQAISSNNNATIPTTNNNNQCRKKTSSFQITSVTVGCRMSNDAGEDSNDDLDESHTEDNNSIEHSRITDIETPSYSEDTFSKDDVFFNANNAALSTAPVIPTSSQYGLAIVPSTEANNPNNSPSESSINTLDIASVTDNDIINLLSNSAKQDVDLREVHSHGRNERFKVVKIESTEPFKRGRWTCMDYLDQTSVNQPIAISQPKASDPNEVCISYGVTDTGIVVPDTTNNKQVVEDKNIVITEAQNGPLSSQDVHQHSSLTSSGYTVNTIPTQQVPSQYYQSPAAATSQQQHQQNQGATLPANLQPAHQSNLVAAQSMPQGTIPLITQATNNSVPSQQNMSHTKEDTYASVVNSQNQNLPPSSAPNSQTPGLIVTQQQNQPSTQNEALGGIQNMQNMQNIHKVPQSGPTQASMQPQQQSNVSTNNATVPGSAGTQVQMTQAVGTMQQGNLAFHQQQSQIDQEQDSLSGIAVGGASGQTITDTALLESLTEVTQNIDDQHTNEDNESMSGTSAVAIDNKIEQAMDLVKSHLMFAVREEVEVLKEKIAELMDRINQLEAENSILKAHATPETLAQLNQSGTPKLSINNTGSGQ